MLPVRNTLSQNWTVQSFRSSLNSLRLVILGEARDLNIITVGYRLDPSLRSGRMTVKTPDSPAPKKPGKKQRKPPLGMLC
jgi:hypothetical protein